MSTRSSHPFGLTKSAINVVLYSESRKPPEVRTVMYSIVELVNEIIKSEFDEITRIWLACVSLSRALDFYLLKGSHQKDKFASKMQNDTYKTIRI